MPYSYENYPPSYHILSDQTRRKAIDIVRVLIRQGMDEKQAIRTAHEQAVAWANSIQSSANYRYHQNPQG